MLVDHDVYITDWHNIRDVPLSEGRFDFGGFVDHVIKFLQVMGPGSHVIAVCQPCVPVLAAAALMAQDGDEAQPRSMTLMAGPVDTRINPTKVNELANERPIEWFERKLVYDVPLGYKGALRSVYPGFMQLAAFLSSGNDAVIFGFLSVSQNGSQTMAGGSFETIPGSVLATFAGNRTASAGSCIAVPPADTYTSTYLFEGASIVLLGTAGQQQLPVDVTGDYGGQLPASWAPSAGEAFTFTGSSRSAAGTWVFSTAANFPAQLDWTNQQSIGAIHRSQGIQLTWTGGDADGVVAIRGSSFAAAGAPAPSGSFLCSVPASAGQFTVPASVLNALPAGAGTLTVENESAPQTIAASGLDIGYAFAGALFTINAAYD